MRASEILAVKGKALYTIAPDKPLTEAVDIMTGHDLGSLVVFSNGSMVGMLTFREVLKAVRKAGADWARVTVGEAMLSEPQVTGPNVNLDDLRHEMIDHHQRYVPLMDAGVLQGVISLYDVAKAVLDEKSFENRMLKNYIKHWPEETEST